MDEWKETQSDCIIPFESMPHRYLNRVTMCFRSIHHRDVIRHVIASMQCGDLDNVELELDYSINSLYCTSCFLNFGRKSDFAKSLPETIYLDLHFVTKLTWLKHNHCNDSILGAFSIIAHNYHIFARNYCKVAATFQETMIMLNFSYTIGFPTHFRHLVIQFLNMCLLFRPGHFEICECSFQFRLWFINFETLLFNFVLCHPFSSIAIQIRRSQ